MDEQDSMKPQPIIPSIKASALSEKDRSLVSVINMGLKSLNQHVEDFASALSLFDFCDTQIARLNYQPSPQAYDEREKMLAWRLISARDGAMSIYHFTCAMEGVKSCVHRIPALAASSDKAASRNATKMFSSYFPNCGKMRHAVAHMAELTESPEKFQKNAFSGAYTDGHNAISLGAQAKNIMISQTLVQRTFTHTIEGQVVSYDLSAETLIALANVRDEFYSSLPNSKFVFRPFSDFDSAMAALERGDPFL